MYRLTAKFIPLLLLTFSAVTALPTPVAGNDVISIPVSFSVDIGKDLIHPGDIADEQSEDRDQGVEVERTPEPESEQSNNEEVTSEVTEVESDENDKDLRSVEEVEPKDKDNIEGVQVKVEIEGNGSEGKIECKVNAEIEDNGCEDKIENKGEAGIKDNGCKDKIENKVEAETEDNSCEDETEDETEDDTEDEEVEPEDNDNTKEGVKVKAEIEGNGSVGKVDNKVDAEIEDSGCEDEIENKGEAGIKDNGCEGKIENKVEAEMQDNSCEDKTEDKTEDIVEVGVNSDVKAGGDEGIKSEIDSCEDKTEDKTEDKVEVEVNSDVKAEGDEEIKSEVEVEVKVEKGDECCETDKDKGNNFCEVNTKHCDKNDKDNDNGIESCSDDVCEENCYKNKFEVEVKIENDHHCCEVHTQCDKQDDCGEKHVKDGPHVCCADDNRGDNNISISSSTCNHSGPNGIQYNSNYNYSCNTRTSHPQNKSPECNDGTTRQFYRPEKFHQQLRASQRNSLECQTEQQPAIFMNSPERFDEPDKETKAAAPLIPGTGPSTVNGLYDYSDFVPLSGKPDNQVLTSKTQEANIGKRSAEPKRLPNHVVMNKHMKLAETSPHLLGVTSTDEISEIWAKNLPYPLDGNPAVPGRGHIYKRSGSESRVAELRQKQNELRGTYGKHTKPTSGELDPVRNADLEQFREDKNALTEELGIGYKLKVGQTEQEKVPEASERNEQQNMPPRNQSCRDNTERNRDKEQMRVGDAGLLAQLFQPQKSE